MKNGELLNKTLSILAGAYFKGTLVHNYCAACAVGNIVAANCGYDVKIELPFKFFDKLSGDKLLGQKKPMWDFVFVTWNGRQFFDEYEYKGEAKRQIDSTGYTWQELAKIEYAFEIAPKEGDWEFNGLVAVYDVLCEIHEVAIDQRVNCSELFVKELA